MEISHLDQNEKRTFEFDQASSMILQEQLGRQEHIGQRDYIPPV
jgi:hypothetical protein